MSNNKWNLRTLLKKETSLPDVCSSSGGSKGKPLSRGNILRRYSERRLVGKISSSLLKSASVTDSGHSCATFTGSSAFSLDFNDSASSLNFAFGEEQGPAEVNCFSPTDIPDESVLAPLHRKELRVGELLGQGAFSKVFAVENIVLRDQHVSKGFSISEAARNSRQRLEKTFPSQKLAVKHLNRKLLKDPEHFQQAALDLEFEAEILSRLCHPNIARIRAVAAGGMAGAFHMGRCHKDYFLVMDRLSDTLDARISRWNDQKVSVSLATKVHYAMELASALDYLHQHKLIFRDLKPQNIGFLEDPTAKHQERLQMFDFGLCRSLPRLDAAHNETFRMSIAGTTRYMCPEMMRERPYNCKADVYSWSMVFFAILAQEKPFDNIFQPHRLPEYVCVMDMRPDMRMLLGAPDAIKELLKATWCASIKDRLTMVQAMEKLDPILKELGEGEDNVSVQQLERSETEIETSVRSMSASRTDKDFSCNEDWSPSAPLATIPSCASICSLAA